MVRLLIRMRAAMLAHQAATRLGIAAGIVLLLFGLLSAGSSFLLGFATYPDTAAGCDAIAAVMFVWIVGRVGFAAFAGGGATVPYEMFRLLPVPRAKLARTLLILGLLDPAQVFLLAAFGSLVVIGARHSAGAAVVGAVGVLLTVVLSSVLVAVVRALLPAGSRRTRDIGTTVVALAISLVAIGGTLLPTITSALTHGTAPALTVAVRALPTGWAADAVSAASAGNLTLTVLPLLGLAGLVAALVAIWPALLSRRLDGRVGAGRARRSRRPRRRLLPATPTGAVMGKELRQWVRDPARATFLMIAFLVGLGVSVVPEATQGTSILLPFAGAITVAIAGAAGANLYGSDGLALRLTVLTPGSGRPDVRGRQAAWLLLVGPYAVGISAILTAVSGQTWAWPWLLGALPALIGGAAGLVPLASVTAVQPPGEDGGPTPTWVVKVYATIILIVTTALPPVALLISGTVGHLGWLRWLAVPVGIATGVALAVGLGRLAARRFLAREQDILAVLTAASNPA
ncbi:ABC-2 type transport system permease protein [Asanoa ferruginea]|uniref:ABC-2 type transport system permease protein n=1 Tax=Asanoa ferruginea TaxID=53367 RepID=A0A3D9ZWA6_9ACTN|nr:hypothetical protein [Asanoa ferruginea]REG01432.1 ABC-2 type transport system permease protein [Asanoa ferruginea]GIF47942.1 hypothetical protein Afe04nite_24810 [Asanoa ferruginea]